MIFAALILAAEESVSNGSTGLDTATVIALITAGVGVAGVIITALKYNKESSARAVEAQSQIVEDMKILNDEMRAKVADQNAEIAELRAQIAGDEIPESWTDG